MLDEDRLRRRRAALHAVDHDDIGTGVYRQLDVVEDPGCTHFHVDGFLPIGDLAQFLNLDDQIVGPRPIGMA